MTDVVYKYAIDPKKLSQTGAIWVEMPRYATLLRCGVQGQGLVVWARVDTDREMVMRRLCVMMTGQPILHNEPPNPGVNFVLPSTVYVDTVTIGKIVCHVFDLGDDTHLKY